MSAVEVVDLSVDLGGRRALDGVSLALAPRERLAVIGRSGAGKTTLLRAVAGLVAPARGAVRLGGAPASDGPRLLVPPERRGVGFVFQGLALWPHLGVEETIAFAAVGTAAERRVRARTLAQRVGLGARLDATPDALSGGEQQRLALARALAADPTVLLLDEPFAHLDPGLRASLVDVLLDLQEGSRAAVLLVSHQRQDVFDLAGRALVLDGGRALEQGPVADLVAAPARRATVDLLGLGAVVGGARTPEGLRSDVGLLPFARPPELARHVLVRPEQARLLPADATEGVAVVVRRSTLARPDALERRFAVRVAPPGSPCEVMALAGRPLAPGSAARLVIDGPCAPLV